MGSTDSSSLDVVLIDGHAHLYDDVPIGSFLESARRRFEAAAWKLGLPQSTTGVLFLLETPLTHAFQRLRAVGGHAVGGWKVRALSDDVSFVGEHVSGGLAGPVLIIGGRQVATRERLEVLALGNLEPISDGLPLSETLDIVKAAGALPVIPWGFGKWWGGRGKLLAEVVAHGEPGSLYIGDCAARPQSSRTPAILKQAANRGILILPGTDPLPFASHAGIAGGYGFALQVRPNAQTPAADLICALRELREQPRVFGSRTSWPGFIRSQVGMQLRRFRRSAHSGPTLAGATQEDPESLEYVPGRDARETPDIVTSSDDYASRFSSRVGAWFLRVQERITLDLLKSSPHATILDIGGGHGQVTQSLLDHGHPVTVLGSAEVTRERIRHLIDGRRCRFDVGDLLALPYADQSFDVVLAYRVTAHVRRWERLLAEMARVARSAVIVDYAEIRSINGAAPLLFKLKKRIESNTRDFQSFRGRQLTDVMTRCGFIRSRRRPQFFLPMALHRAMKSPRLSAAAESVCRILGLTRMFGSPVIIRYDRAREDTA